MPRLFALLLIALLPLSLHAAPEPEQSGRWVALNPALTQLLAPPREALTEVNVNPAGGGVLWHELRVDLSRPRDLVLDFASSSTLDHFDHWVFDRRGQLVAHWRGGLRHAEPPPYFLRHGRDLTLSAGQYRILSRLESPFYLALPEPHLFDRADYRQRLPLPQSLTLVGLGIFLALMFYYAVMALWRRSGTDLLYALFILGNLLYNGAALLVYSQLFGWTWFYLISAPILISNAVYVLFVMRLLGIERDSQPELFWLGSVALAVLVSFWPLALIWPNWSLEFCRIGVAIFALYGLLSGITRTLQGSRVARFYLFANAAFAVPALVAISIQSTSHPLWLVEHLGMVAVLIEVLLLAQVVSYQIGTVYRERAETRSSLERTRLLDKLTAQAPGVLFQAEMTPDGRFTLPFASPRLTEYLEMTPEQAAEPDSGLLGRVHPDDRNDLVVSMVHSARRLTPWHASFRVLLPERGLLWLEGSARPERLPDQRTRWYGFLSDATERKRLEEHMRHLAQHDPLTDLPNRTLFADRLDQALRRARRQHGRVALLFVDLDSFKPVNDQYGHELGDQLLKLVSRAMSTRLRAADTLARMGGDEFVVLLTDVGDPAEARAVAEQLRDICDRPFAVGELEVRISASLGLALFPDHGETSEALIRAADLAMYRAKQAGGNRVSVSRSS